MSHVLTVHTLIGIAALSIVIAHGAGAQARPTERRERARSFAQPDTGASAPEPRPTRASPPPPRVDTALTILAPPPSAPPPPRVGRANVPSRDLTPTAPVVLPMPPAGPPPEVALRRQPQAVLTPPTIERPAPRPRALRVETQLLQSVLLDQPEPAGATGRCKDGTFLTGPVTEARCADKGGLAILIPARRAAPPRPLVTP